MVSRTGSNSNHGRPLSSPGGFAYSDAARLAAVLEAAVDAIISIDSHGAVQVMNPAAERLFGYAAAEVVGQNVKLLMPQPFRDEHDGYIARYLKTGERRIIGVGREALGLRKDGSTFPMELAVAEAKLGAESIFVGIIRDITERKRAEATRSQLAAIVESSGEAIIAADLQGCVVSWNAGAEHIFDLPATEAIGRPLTAFLPALGQGRYPLHLVRQRRSRLQAGVARRVKDQRGVRARWFS